MSRSSRNLIFAATFGVALILLMKFTAPSEKWRESPEYQAACQGAPLRTMGKRIQAEEDGYDINKAFDCIDKASYVAMTEARAAAEAAKTPEGIAKQKEEYAAANARLAEQRQRKEAEHALLEEASRPRIVLRRVDANTASQTDLAGVISLDPEVAAQIVAARDKRRFANWDDLISRVVGLSAAQSAAYASICGLTVDGKGMFGAPLNADMAASVYERRHDQRPIVSLSPADGTPTPEYEAPGLRAVFPR